MKMNRFFRTPAPNWFHSAPKSLTRGQKNSDSWDVVGVSDNNTAGVLADEDKICIEELSVLF